MENELCAVCKKRPKQQEHHLTYEPPLLINVCIECHQLIHNHGVGKANGHTKNKAEAIYELEEIDMGTWTFRNLDDNKIYLRETGAIMFSMACGCLQYPDGYYDESLELYADRAGKHPNLYLKCGKCGRDVRIHDYEVAERA